MNALQIERAPRLRRVALLTSLAALALAVLMVTLLEVFRRRDTHLDTLAAHADIVAGNSAAALVFRDQRSAREALATLAGVDDILHATLYDRQGERFAAYERAVAGGDADAPQALAAVTPADAIDWSTLTVTRLVKAERRVVGALRISASRASDWRQLLWYALTLLGVAGASLGGAYALLARARRGAMLAEEALAWRAHHDPVSGLPNRYLFMDRMEQALARARRAGTQLALIYFDLDHFKAINDTIGHEAGDAALRETARRAAARLRASDTLARMSGDEFAVLLEPLNDPAHARAVAGQLMEALNAPYELGGRQVFLGASIGIAVFATDGDNGEALLRAADTAMYYAKGHGRNNIQFYTSALNENLEQRLQFQSRLRHALLHDELEMHYQPIVLLENGETAGYEALLRWRHPERGMLDARDFLAEVEQAGMAHLIGEAVLRFVCRDCDAWRASGHVPPPVAVNMSMTHLIRPEAPAAIAAILERHGMRPEQFEIEISELKLHAQSNEMLRVLGDLRSRGFRLGVDDFGAGFVSLRTLKRLAVTRVKIDGAIIAELPSDADDAGFVRAVLALGRSLGFAVVAKGVETDAQAAFLRSEGCALAQGYYFGRPVPAAEILRQTRKQSG